MSDEAAPQGQLLIYSDGELKLQVRLDGQTVWLTQAQLAELYSTTPQNITLHIQGIYDDRELPETATCKEYLQVRQEGARTVQRSLKHYSLDVILAIGYRVRSPRGTAFRQWATARLSELLVKGFTLDDQRIKAGRTIGADYFDELLSRIRDIRASERLFYQKITDIYATSIDYDANVEMTHLFFQTVQNKMHWATHGHTAAEIVATRADASQPNMGLTTWKNAPAGAVRKGDITIAKNYLTKEEIDALNLMVSAYLDFAELQARSHRPMHMTDWIGKLDDFIRLSERDILAHAGRVSHQQAEQHARAQYEQYESKRRELANEQISDFDEVTRRLTQETTAPQSRRRKKKDDRDRASEK
ncbi:MAG: virulence RhuM family protein [Planctomycetia bacterium]|nr:virulence RhuM family protein [Planctomycetia bacterium]